MSFVDFSDYFCGRAWCRAVVGNVLGYLDDNHVTAKSMTTLSPIVEKGDDGRARLVKVAGMSRRS